MTKLKIKDSPGILNSRKIDGMGQNILNYDF